MSSYLLLATLVAGSFGDIRPWAIRGGVFSAGASLAAGTGDG